jgi:L-rhamnose-H+ transport protein
MVGGYGRSFPSGIISYGGSMAWILVAALGGLCIGSFGLPMKWTTRWNWEHTWSLYAFWALLVAPWVLAYMTIPDLFELYRQTSWAVLGAVAAFGTVWGIASITFGLGLAYMGLAIGYSLMIGLIIVSGSLLPLITNPVSGGFTNQVAVLIAGISVMIVSLILNIIAAQRKEKELSGRISRDSGPIQSFGKGLLVCVITGVVGCGLNYSYIAGDSMVNHAIEMGSAKELAANSVLPIALLGASLLNIGYCFRKVHAGKTWKVYVAHNNKKYFVYTMLMAIWTVGIASFGVAAANMGKLGNSVGWAVLNSSAIICVNLIGIISGEWKNVSVKTIRILILALLIMISGICLVGWANSLI